MSLDDLVHLRREADGDPAGALVLFHGRGTSEHDLVPLFDLLDPGRRLLGVTPRGPLTLPPGGAHWYVVRQVGFPDPDSFFPTFTRASRWLDSFYEETGLGTEKTVLGGFSQGAVMSYALGLGTGRARPAGLMAFSGFMPTVEGFDYDLENLDGFPVAIGHGTYDPVITVDFGHDARHRLEEAGAAVTYHESAMDHTIDPNFLVDLQPWLRRVL
jgi:phospholipase/carboxylesterase